MCNVLVMVHAPTKVPVIFQMDPVFVIQDFLDQHVTLRVLKVGIIKLLRTNVIISETPMDFTNLKNNSASLCFQAMDDFTSLQT